MAELKMSETLEAYLSRKRNSSDVTAPQTIPLNKSKITFGRTADSDILIKATFISRVHAVINKTDDDSWSLTDKSSNGFYINGVKLTRDAVIALHHNDTLSFGPNAAQDLTYVFKIPEKDSKMSVIQYKEKRPRLEPVDVIVISDDDDDDGPSVSEKRYKIRDAASPGKQELIDEKNKLEKKLAEMKAELDKKNSEAQQELEKKKMELSLKEQEYELRLKKNSHVQMDLDQQLHKISAELKAARDEKLMLQSGLQQLEANRTKELAMELERAGLEWTLTEKEKLCEELKLKLTEAEEKLKANIVLAQNVNSEEEISKKVSNTVENELQCSICSEIFIKAVTLSCSHSFCEYCINQWKKTKQECPMCRKPISSSVSSLALDNFISQYITTQPADVQERRKETVTERQAAISAAAADVPSSSTSGRNATTYRRATRSVTTRTAGSTNRGAISMLTGVRRPVLYRNNPNSVYSLLNIRNPADPPEQHQAIDLSSTVDIATDDDEGSFDDQNDANTDTSESEPDSYDSGIHGAYYGGYGNCYMCGRAGHWANGCPY